MGRIKNGHPVCSRPVELEGQNLIATMVELVLGFIVPFPVMSSFYVCLYQKVTETAAEVRISKTIKCTIWGLSHQKGTL